MVRTDILHSDVFFSWTGVDRDLKNKIVAYLRKNNISCTESDYACSGDFQQWSREAVSKSTVFLLLYTEDTPNSKYVPVEIKAFMELEDPYNRCVPVVTDFDLYAKNLPALADRESAVILDKNGITEQHLELILTKVRSLICNRLFARYRQATAPTYMRFVSLLRELRMTAEFEHEKLYINRSVTDEDGQTISDAAAFCRSKDIIYLYGPAGSGKTCYIDQLRSAADKDTLVLTLPCRKLLKIRSLFDEMYAEFCRYCGNRDYFTPENFRSLLSVKHLLLVLDGLDEIGTKEGKEALFSATRDYYVVNAESTTLFITSRSSTDADMWKMNGQTPKVMRLHALEEDQIKEFGSKLFLLLGYPDKGEEFYISIHGLSEEIRTNPLLLSQLAIIYKEKNEIPQTVVGIYDAVWEIMVDKVKPSEAAPAAFDNTIFQKLSAILKSFSAERYRLLSQGKAKTIEQIFKKILRDHDCNPGDAPALIRYLQDRAIMVGNEFYHKMLLEYFTAMHYYEQCFDDYDELENHDVLSKLFEHYDDLYWSAVLHMFLVKADSRTDADATEGLYRAIMTFDITDFTLLFDTCRDLLYHKETARTALLSDILERSATGVYPPYGPLCWYVPEYDLYFDLFWALDALQEAPCFTKALALTRDVCWIFGKYHTAEAANNWVNGKALLEKANLSGIRKGLCELFYQGSTDCADGRDIYPRCFNLAEAERWKAEGIGIYGRMGTAFEDELGLYSHEMLTPFGDEWVGVVSMGHDVERIEEILPSRSCRKLRGLFLSPGKDIEMQKLAINDKHIRVLYLPENIQYAQQSSLLRPFAYEGTYVDEHELMYFGEKLIFPDGMTEIEGCAFSGGSLFTSVTIPEGATKIGSYVFFGCSSLTTITIPESIIEIGSGAFSGCSSLTSITLPDSITKIGFSVFYDCSALTSIRLPDQLREIDLDVFYNCTALARISNCPAFCNRRLLGVSDECVIVYREIGQRDIVFHSETQILPDEFYNREDITYISIPKGVTRIGRAAFSGCSTLTSITIPQGVTEIGSSAFSGCSSLTSITIPEGITEIGSYTFVGCRSLTSITIPNSINKIKFMAFSGCSALTSIRLPDQLREIERNVFYNCTALTHIANCPAFCNRRLLGVSDECVIVYREIGQRDIVFHSETEILTDEFCHREDIRCISVPKGVTKIGRGAFSFCRFLTSITLPEGVTEIEGRVFEGCSLLTSITIPESVSQIGEYAFSGCSSLSSIMLPQSLAEIKGSAFSGCSSLTSITIPKGITKIEFSTFSRCSSLTSATIPEGITEIGSYAFNGCRLLSSVTIPEGVTKIRSSAFSDCSSLTSIMLPEGVTEIGERAFEACCLLTSITIPDSVTKIDEFAFLHCRSLISITISKGLTKIEREVFSDCDSLTSITIPDSVTKIGYRAFFFCSSLSFITIPDSVTEIGGDAFFECRSLTSITIPEGVTKIEPHTFSRCSSLTSATIPEGITEIGSYAFNGCRLLSSVTIPESVTEIGKEAFEGCSSLTSIAIPKAVRFIGDEAFAGCTGLQEITLSRRFEDDLPRIFKDVDLSEVKITWL